MLLAGIKEMPLYEYECSSCGGRFERIQRFADPPIDRCVLCGQGPVQKLLSAPAFHFKGTGWYVTDYPKKGAGNAAEPASSDTAKPSDTKAAGDSKPAASSPQDAGGEKKPTAPASSGTP